MVELFVVGIFLSWSSCALFCEPLLLPYFAATRKGWKEGLTAVLVFSGSRLAVICLLGGLMGAVGTPVVDVLRRHSNLFYYCAGSLVAVAGLAIVLGREIGHGLCARLHSVFAQDRSKGPALLGAADGMVPCLPFVGALALIAAQGGGFVHGAALGIAFGLGKSLSPVLLGGVLASWLPERLISNLAGLRLARRLGGATLFLAGLNIVAARAFGA
jgi:sulfite exporter TauE/SafE